MYKNYVSPIIRIVVYCNVCDVVNELVYICVVLVAVVLYRKMSILFRTFVLVDFLILWL